MNQIPASKRPVEYVLQRPAAPGVSNTSGRNPDAQRAFARVMTQQAARLTPDPAPKLSKEQPGRVLPEQAVGTLAARESGAIAKPDQVLARGTSPQSERAASDSVGVQWGAAAVGTPEYKFDFGPSSLDPGSMAFLLAWMGGSPEHKSLKTQQQEYLTYYRDQHPNGVANVNSYASATTDYLTGKA